MYVCVKPVHAQEQAMSGGVSRSLSLAHIVAFRGGVVLPFKVAICNFSFLGSFRDSKASPHGKMQSERDYREGMEENARSNLTSVQTQRHERGQ